MQVLAHGIYRHCADYYTETMNADNSDFSPSPEARRDAAVEQLDVVTEHLQAARKELRRDWEQLQPRERSEQSRRVKDLEHQETQLLETIESHLE